MQIKLCGSQGLSFENDEYIENKRYIEKSRGFGLDYQLQLQRMRGGKEEVICVLRGEELGRCCVFEIWEEERYVKDVR